MKTSDIRRVIRAGLADVTTTQRDVDAVMEYIRNAENQQKPRWRSGGMRKVLLAAVCLVLMLSAVAQALGIPVWQALVVWTKETLRIETFQRNTVDASQRSCFSDEERAAWGEDVENAFSGIGLFPFLPGYMPDGFELCDLYCTGNDDGYACVDALYEDEGNHILNLVADVYTTEGYSYTLTVEHDDLDKYDVVLDGVTYYFVSNLQNNTVVWNDSNGSYCISGNVEMSTLEEMIRSIRRGAVRQ
ncbi:MAG: DUF4367 domain-containing protein [Clostridia bacterium]|nr:DUF4367 domain-containing protein [Clostridia bacterium]